MTEERRTNFLRAQNLVFIAGMVIMITALLLLFQHLERRIKNLENTVDQILQEVAVTGKKAPSATPTEEILPPEE